MGTHPIFESDFDCLTEKFAFNLKMTEKFQGLVNLLPSRAITKPDDDDVEPLLRDDTPPKRVIIIQQPTDHQTTERIFEAELPSAFLMWLTCLCCFWPLSIAAIVFRNKAIENLKNGDRKNFDENVKDSKKWTLSSFIVGSIITIAYVTYVLVINLR